MELLDPGVGVGKAGVEVVVNVGVGGKVVGVRVNVGVGGKVVGVRVGVGGRVVEVGVGVGGSVVDVEPSVGVDVFAGVVAVAVGVVPVVNVITSWGPLLMDEDHAATIFLPQLLPVPFRMIDKLLPLCQPA